MEGYCHSEQPGHSYGSGAFVWCNFHSKLLGQYAGEPTLYIMQLPSRWLMLEVFIVNTLDKAAIFSTCNKNYY